MLFSADFYPTQEEAIAQLGQYFQSPEEDDVDESGILQVLHKVELKEADSEYLQARTANIMEKIPEIDEKLNQAAAGWKTKRMGKVEPVSYTHLGPCPPAISRPDSQPHPAFPWNRNQQTPCVRTPGPA